MTHRVAVTGMGIVCPMGNTVAQVWQRIQAGESGISKLDQEEFGALPVKFAGVVKDFDPAQYMDKKEARRMDRYCQFVMAAGAQAMADAGLASPECYDSRRFGVIVGTGMGGLITLVEDTIKADQKNYERINPLIVPMSIANMATAHLSIQYGLEGPSTCVNTACATGNNAIGDGFRLIKHGYADKMLCGGSDADIIKVAIAGFNALQALSISQVLERASIPFDKERNGFVMGEGAAILVLENYEQAKKRGAKIYGEILGYGQTSDAYHMTAPHPEAKGAIRAMELALEEGGVPSQCVDYINAHGTSTVYNDRIETMAIKRLFGSHAYELAVSSTKSMTGHLLGGAGAVEAVFTLLAIAHSFLPPTINYQVRDEELDLDYVPNMGRPSTVKYALSNSFGFGGHNAVLLFGKGE
ncbi:MAG: beta-ketoacyl-ACP synthase II [Christensenellales bacterium]